ncbi:MAG TPA: carbohydrate ABC transporter permease [Candidatus Atribacteria bacterium]|nr:carbohydrate ABC transporter permease [Candidatus Atribacteria bacterium]HQE24803.1 carbohydrate ABC transporter permease [Candidatus Atribacteria bacterium]
MTNWKKVTVKGVGYIIALFLALLVILPFLMMFLGSFRQHTDIIRRGPLVLPTEWNLNNYHEVLFKHHFNRYYINSILITVPVVVGSLIFALMAAFAFSFMNFPFKKMIFLFVVSLGVMVAEVFIMIPLFQLMNSLKLIDNLLAVILPSLAMSACFSTLVIHSFFMGLPHELFDSALVDGASSWQTLWKIYTPLAKPAIGASGALTTVWTWNTYITPLILLHDPAKAPLPLGLALFQGQYVADIPLLMAGATLTALPPILVYLLFQPQVVAGVTHGALK